MKQRCFLPQKPQLFCKCHARLAREYTDEADEIATQKLRLLRLNHLIFTLLVQALFFYLRYVIVFD